MNKSESLGTLLHSEGYSRKAPGIYCRIIDLDWSGYISFDEQGDTLHAVGVVCQRANRLMYAVLKRISTGSPVRVRATKYGPPICQVSPIVLNSDAWRSHTPLPLADICDTIEVVHIRTANLLGFLRAKVYPFVMHNTVLGNAIETALLYNKFMQAQRFILPAEFLLHDNRLGFSSYTDQCLAFLKNKQEREFYALYIAQIAEHIDSDLTPKLE